MTSRLLVRADGSVTRGLGHVLRCVALAEEARSRGLDTLFVVGTDATAERALADRSEAFRTVESDDRSWLDDLVDTDLVVIDGPELYTAVSAIRERGARVAVIDDADGDHPDAQVVVAADRTVASSAASHQVRLLGPAHALVRREFRDHRGLAVEPPTEVLTLLGGTDPGGQLAAVAAAVANRLPAMSVRPLRIAAAEQGGVAAALVAGGAAVSAAGTAAWELLCVGVPSALVVAAEDQYEPARLIADAGAALVLGTVDDALATGFAGVEALTDPDQRARLVEAGLELVDGRGAERVLDALLAS